MTVAVVVGHGGCPAVRRAALAVLGGVRDAVDAAGSERAARRLRVGKLARSARARA